MKKRKAYRKIVGNDKNLGILLLQEISELIAHGLLPDKTCRAGGRLTKYCWPTKNNLLNAIFTCPEEKCWSSRLVLGVARQTPMNL